MNAHELRKDFPLLRGGSAPLYFDSAATALKPKSVIDAVSGYYSNYSANIHRSTYNIAVRASEAYENARDRVRAFLGANEDYEIIFTSGTSDSITFVALAWEYLLRERGKEASVSVTEIDHHSGFLPWQQVCERTRSRFLVIPVHTDGERSGTLDMETASSYIEQSDLLCMSGMSNVTGYVPPLDAIISECKKQSCRLLVDAAQMLAHRDFSLEEYEVDALAFSAHKLCGPTGIGVLCIKKEWLAEFPRIKVGGGTIRNVTAARSTFLSTAEGYEAGTPNIAGAIGMEAALQYLEAIGMEKIAQHEKKLRRILLDAISVIPHCRIVGGKNISESGIVSITSEAMHALDMAFILQQHDILLRTGHLCAQPLLRSLGCESVVRFSCYLYNTEEEIAKLKNALRTVETFL